VRLRWTGLLLLVLVLLGSTAHAAPEQELQEAARAYGRGEYQRVIQLVRPLLYPFIRLSSVDKVIQAYRILGISYIFEKDPEQAEKQFMAILAHQPEHSFDPLVDPPAAAKLLEELKQRNAEKLRAIKERERREAERLRQEELRRREEQARALANKRSATVIERTVIHRPYWVNFVPFGAGQFQNGHRRKGLALLGSELSLGALSLGTALAFRLAWPDGHVDRADYDRANALRVTQVTSGALFFAVAAYGIIDALYYHQPQSSTERRYEQKSSVTLVPMLGSVSGLGLGLTF